MISGLKVRITQLRTLLCVYRISYKVFKDPIKAFRALRSLFLLRKNTHNQKLLPRLARVDGRNFSTENIPAWPSSTYKKFMRNELENIRKGNNVPQMHTAIFSITSRCSLQCKHCYEWDNITATERLSLSDLKQILYSLNEYGISHIQFSGGEPLLRFDDLLELIKQEREIADCWILSSGMQLTADYATRLKEAGLTGALISLDHWQESLHNEFRKNEESFYWVKEAIKNCNSEGIVAALSICLTEEFVSEENLWRYAELARSWGVQFIRLLEPRSVGKFKDIQVALPGSVKKIVEKFFLEINARKKYSEYPLVTYPGFHQKHQHCFGAGKRYMYIDSLGDVHACPFCQGKVGNMLENDLQTMITELRSEGCHMFR